MSRGSDVDDLSKVLFCRVFVVGLCASTSFVEMYDREVDLLRLSLDFFGPVFATTCFRHASKTISSMYRRGYLKCAGVSTRRRGGFHVLSCYAFPLWKVGHVFTPRGFYVAKGALGNVNKTHDLP